MERIVTLNLFGEEFKLKAGSNVENVEEVADFLVDEVDKIDSGSDLTRTNLSKFSTLLVASLNITKEYMDLKKRYATLYDEVNKRSREVLTSMDGYISIDD